MLNNYLKIAWRHLLKNKMYSFINIGGLAVGMTVAMLISLWVYDELSFEKYHKNYDQVVQILSNNQVGDGVSTEASLPLPLSLELKSKYGSDFEYVTSTLNSEQAIVYENDVFLKKGSYLEPSFVDIFTLNMLHGDKHDFVQVNTIFLNAMVSKTLFGNTDPIAYYFMHSWLQDFTYRIEIEW